MFIKDKLGPIAYENLLHTAIFNTGDSTKIWHMLMKLQTNHPLRMVTLGGSVTEGLTSTKRISHPYGLLIQDFLAHHLYGERHVPFLNMGISCSYPLLGLCLTESHIRDFAPDLIIVEFAINESLDKGGILRFESLIRKLITLPTAPTLIILNLEDAKGYTASSYMSHIGKHYNLPVINIGDALRPYFKNQTLCWTDYSSDSLHPHEGGHQLIADCCCFYLKQISHLKNMQKSNMNPSLPSCCFLAPYEHLEFLSAPMLYHISQTNFISASIPNVLFPKILYNDILLHSAPHNLTFSLKCKCLIILFFQNHTSDFATATVCVDHETTHFLQGYYQFIDQYPRPQCIIDEPIAKLHHIEIQLNGIDAHKQFMIIGIAYCK